MTLVLWFTLVLSIVLALITVIDMKEFRIPDYLNMLLVLGGALYWVLQNSDRLLWQIVSGALVALFLWFVRFAHARTTGRIGLGLGDVKMAGAGALWINPLSLPLFMFLASSSGLTFILLRGRKRINERIAFGPFLATGLMLTWLLENLS